MPQIFPDALLKEVQIMPSGQESPVFAIYKGFNLAAGVPQHTIILDARQGVRYRIHSVVSNLRWFLVAPPGGLFSCVFLGTINGITSYTHEQFSMSVNKVDSYSMIDYQNLLLDENTPFEVWPMAQNDAGFCDVMVRYSMVSV